MGKKRKNILMSDRERWISQWLKARAEGKYIPYFMTQDVNSTGLRYRVPSHTSERAHHFLSTNEYLFHFRHAFNQCTIEEQFVLPLSETRAVATQLGVKHPSYGSRVLAPVTTDFVVYDASGTQ